MKAVTENIKDFIWQNHKLSFPNFKQKFTLNCDASEVGMCGVLYQEDRIIGYFSKKLSQSEINYTIMEIEYLSIVSSMIHFKKVIQGSYAEIKTDSKNRVLGSKNETSRIKIWMLNMNKFDYNILHVDGKDNIVADNLSGCYLINNEKDNNGYIKIIKLLQ